MRSFAGQIYRNGKLAPGILHVDDDGIITKVARTDTAAEHIDFGKKVLLPGAIDVHVHFRDPGATHKEDWHTGSVSAAFGGVTGVVDMPNTLPPTTTPKLVQEKLQLAAEKSVIDYGIWAGGTWYTGDVDEMLRHAVGMKVFLGASTGDLLLEDAKAFKEILQKCGKAGKPIILHCESERVLRQYKRQEMELADHDVGRPPVAEVEAIYDVMKTMPGIKPAPRVHVAHAASADAAKAAVAAKFSVGVCPHHLLLTYEGWEMKQGFGKMNPPLRTAARRDELWELFAAGKVPILESDHAPHTKTEKDDLFSQAPAGVPGVETMLPLLLAKVKAKKVELATVVDAATKAPAALIGANDRGSLEKGMRADFGVYDMKVTKIDAADLHSACKWAPYEGMDAIFPTHTFLAGKEVVAERELVAPAGSGRSILPEA